MTLADQFILAPQMLAVKKLTHQRIFVHTHFGAAQLDVTKEKSLCVPSLVTVL